jgi:hypothetical protein
MSRDQLPYQETNIFAYLSNHSFQLSKPIYPSLAYAKELCNEANLKGYYRRHVFFFLPFYEELCFDAILG